MLIDSHCHLDYYTEEELPGILAEAAAAGVGEMVSIGTTVAQSLKIRDLVETHANLWCTIGIHPHSAGSHAVPEPAELAEMTRHPKVIGIGEAGLDYFYDKAPRPLQQECFRAQIRAARLADLPICIHARAADEDMIRVLREERAAGGDFAFLLHCFSSGRELAEAAVAMGGFLSFSGILTFPKSEEIRAIAVDMPADRLLVETDAPYLAPVPWRGKRNQPAWVAHTARMLAEIRGVGMAEIEALTTANFRRLFRKAAPSA